MKNVESLGYPASPEVIERLRETVLRQSSATLFLVALMIILAATEAWASVFADIHFPGVFYLTITSVAVYGSHAYFTLRQELKDLSPASAEVLASIGQDIESLPGAQEYLSQVQSLSRSVTEGEVNRIARLANLFRLEVEQVN